MRVSGGRWLKPESHRLAGASLGAAYGGNAQRAQPVSGFCTSGRAIVRPRERKPPEDRAGLNFGFLHEDGAFS